MTVFTVFLTQLHPSNSRCRDVAMLVLSAVFCGLLALLALKISPVHNQVHSESFRSTLLTLPHARKHTFDSYARHLCPIRIFHVFFRTLLFFIRLPVSPDRIHTFVCAFSVFVHSVCLCIQCVCAFSVFVLPTLPISFLYTPSLLSISPISTLTVSASIHWIAKQWLAFTCRCWTNSTENA